ncbi:hypothetical protein ACOCG7_01010 [Paraburkholderia sp. DD10]|uniref:hypothetical protein n=1 Tax=Paraburkholderia TaxID=1822464 RepID=UPI0009F24BD7|nr:hypothetical protein B2G74_06235 [Burkholderia sp. A27]
MRRDKRLASALFIALAMYALSGCGADDSPPAATASTTSASSSPTIANNNDVAQNAGTSSAASTPLAENPFAASDAITQNMQASLAADSRQVAPVMRYAPGDSAGSN